MAANSTEILHDFSPMVRIHKDGRVERLSGMDIVPASVDPETGVQSKDVQFSSQPNVSARLFLPGKANPGRKLPLLVYFHGGGFLVDSPFSQLYHNHLNFLVAAANVVAVSVNYRLAPEHPVPTAYEDSWLALKWLADQSIRDDDQESWIKEYADLDHVYLGGDSAGANIAHHMAIRFGLENLGGIKLNGIFLNCPYFWGKDPIGNEATNLSTAKSYVDNIWLYACPNTTGLDDPLINPAMDSNLSRLGCQRILVYVAEKDILKDRGFYYKEALKKCGWNGNVEIVEVEGEGHVFSVFFPNSVNGKAMLKRLADFMNQ